MLILSCILFTVYCIPWSVLLPGHDWIATVFLLEDWSWFAMMIPITLWYWISLKWIDKHSGWENARPDTD